MAAGIRLTPLLQHSFECFVLRIRGQSWIELCIAVIARQQVIHGIRYCDLYAVRITFIIDRHSGVRDTGDT